MGASQNKIKNTSQVKLINGQPHGSGKLTIDNGDKLEGSFVNGKLEGFGKQ